LALYVWRHIRKAAQPQPISSSFWPGSIDGLGEPAVLFSRGDQMVSSSNNAEE
jgi:hypothetical protein